MPFSLVQSVCSIPVASVDVETSGASADMGDRVIEVGIVRYENGREVARYEQLIDPQRRISAGVTALTGISQTMCDGQPTFAQQFPAMMQLLCGAAILDTVRIARRRFGRGGNSLVPLARRLGCEPEIAHRALADALTTAIVFDRLLAPAGGWQMSLCDVYLQQGGPMKHASQRNSALPLELEEALAMGRPVLLEYLDANQTRSERVIDPIQIRRASGELVLIAHCHLRNDRRHFKLERIVRLTRIEAEADAAQICAASNQFA